MAHNNWAQPSRTTREQSDDNHNSQRLRRNHGIMRAIGNASSDEGSSSSCCLLAEQVLKLALNANETKDKLIARLESDLQTSQQSFRESQAHAAELALELNGTRRALADASHRRDSLEQELENGTRRALAAASHRDRSEKNPKVLFEEKNEEGDSQRVASHDEETITPTSEVSTERLSSSQKGTIQQNPAEKDPGSSQLESGLANSKENLVPVEKLTEIQKGEDIVTDDPSKQPPTGVSTHKFADKDCQMAAEPENDTSSAAEKVVSVEESELLKSPLPETTQQPLADKTDARIAKLRDDVRGAKKRLFSKQRESKRKLAEKDSIIAALENDLLNAKEKIGLLEKELQKERKRFVILELQQGRAAQQLIKRRVTTNLTAKDDNGEPHFKSVVSKNSESELPDERVVNKDPPSKSDTENSESELQQDRKRSIILEIQQGLIRLQRPRSSEKEDESEAPTKGATGKEVEEILNVDRTIKVADQYFASLTGLMQKLLQKYREDNQSLQNPRVRQQLKMEFAAQASDAGKACLKSMSVTWSQFEASVKAHSNNVTVGRALSKIQKRQQEELLVLESPGVRRAEV